MGSIDNFTKKHSFNTRLKGFIIDRKDYAIRGQE